MNRLDSSSVVTDRTLIKRAMLAHDPHWRLPNASVWWSTKDIVVDWLLILLAVWTVSRVGWCGIPVTLIIIGNRQRALGNLLHEASHHNLSTSRQVNDRLARLLLGPPLQNNLTEYRKQHAQHHAWLGDSIRDPDLLRLLVRQDDSWYQVYLRALCEPSALRSSLCGHLVVNRLTWQQRFGILGWWCAVELALAVTVGVAFALLFVALWFFSKATVFHAITTFREMTDHYGLQPGGIFTFTRDIPDHGLFSVLLHPHHNGYHLTHHLFPQVPYDQLSSVHARLMELGEFKSQAIVCPAYLRGSPSGVIGWGAHHG